MYCKYVIVLFVNITFCCLFTTVCTFMPHVRPKSENKSFKVSKFQRGSRLELGPQYPLACRLQDGLTDGTEKTETPLYSRCGTVKISLSPQRPKRRA
jgi:hypothetical protein